MPQEYNDLQAKYINGVSTLSLAEAKRFLTLITDDLSAPFRERRIESLNRYIASGERRTAFESEQDRRNYEGAVLWRDTTDRWIEMGATHLNPHAPLVIWEYEGVEFYRWWSGTNVHKEAPLMKAADERLRKLIAEKKDEKEANS